MHNTLYLAFDIETIPVSWDTLSESQQEYLLRRTETEEQAEQAKKEMALSPLTAHVVCIGLQMVKEVENGEYSILTRKAFSFDSSIPEGESKDIELSTGDVCTLCSEKEMLSKFWGIFEKRDKEGNYKYRNVHLLSFNGRNFDAPFLMLRSAILGIRPSRDLMSGTKYNYKLHTDLIDELTFYSPSSYGATKRYNFDFYARAFGLQSPKAEGIDGSKVSEFFHEGRIAEITEYCLRDVDTTWKLFEIWKKLLCP